MFFRFVIIINVFSYYVLQADCSDLTYEDVYTGQGIVSGMKKLDYAKILLVVEVMMIFNLVPISLIT